MGITHISASDVRVTAVHMESWLGGREECSQHAIADHTALVFNIRGAANARSVLSGGLLARPLPGLCMAISSLCPPYGGSLVSALSGSKGPQKYT